MMVLQSDQVEIINDWHVMGMTAISLTNFISGKEQSFTEEDRAHVTSFSASLRYALKTFSDMAKQLPFNLPPVATLTWPRYRLGLSRLWIAWNDRGRVCNRDLGGI
ncbi:hypothetical protein GOZ97_08725 [Agrobacterium vitis]|uniref:hypothetical protein n=1 Tax=Rhizobium/Agrobacterium group TaxID=227290 RepID=UPI0008DC02B0|nr:MULTISPECIES: hypothetical protein [Rhizobium/Agrobacterium group]MCF1435376.1 hypothetical protein [Allorhizobium ampelinum]MUO89783.1 hypothetical protein [Agrobacterium vitis]MUZ53280.1 hypothetical protein [Agrobacterium vitis]MUZ91499.1 hypothetical protein [Agrobacterium vitis]MVA40056.1 hypothetical protein [Agrobacterium vitis]